MTRYFRYADDDSYVLAAPDDSPSCRTYDAGRRRDLVEVRVVPIDAVVIDRADLCMTTPTDIPDTQAWAGDDPTWIAIPPQAKRRATVVRHQVALPQVDALLDAVGDLIADLREMDDSEAIRLDGWDAAQRVIEAWQAVAR